MYFIRQFELRICERMCDEECQADELLALENIYTQEEFEPLKGNDRLGGNIFAVVGFENELKLLFKDLREPESNYQEVSISYLPPLVLLFSFPKDYPSSSPPDFTLSCQWLRRNHISKLCRKLDELWEENKGMEIIYIWTQFLKEESLRYLGVHKELDMSRMYTYYLRCVEQGPRRTRGIHRRQRGAPCPGWEPRRGSRHQGCWRSAGQAPAGNASETERPKSAAPCVEEAAQTECACGSASASTRQRRNQRKARNSTFAHPQQQTGAMRPRGRQELDRRAVTDLNPHTAVIQHLVDYNASQVELQFERAMHTCNICFQDKLGVSCFKFEPCGHVFCTDCVTSYFEVRIAEGTVLSMPCPEDKCSSEAQPWHVRALVSPDTYNKYDSILLSAVLDTQPNLVHCPRRQCQYPVIHEDKSDKLATCPECSYAFCVLCEKVYHGVAPCAIIPEEKRRVMEEYKRAGDAEKRQMEARFGKQQLKNLVDAFHLEWSEWWIKTNSKKCPHCNTSIEKESGCNKMQCWKCETQFCWLCSMKLDKLRPYYHFNNPSSPCYNNLFQGMDVAEDFDDEFDIDEELDED